MATTRAVRHRQVTLYQTSWCPHSRRVRTLLEQRGIPHTSVDIEQDEVAARQVETWNRGYRSVPTLLLHLIVTEPSSADLERLLVTSRAARLACTVYATTWCPDCRRTLAWLKEHAVAYTSVDIDADEAAAQKVEDWNQGNRSVPTLDLTLRLTEPRPEQLEAALGIGA